MKNRFLGMTFCFCLRQVKPQNDNQKKERIFSESPIKNKMTLFILLSLLTDAVPFLKARRDTSLSSFGGDWVGFWGGEVVDHLQIFAFASSFSKQPFLSFLIPSSR